MAVNLISYFKMIAIIAARGGSRGLKNKNILKLGNKPIIAHSITSALKSKYISKVIVSTDSKTIAKISKKYGAEVPFMRPKKLSGYNASILDAFKHAIDFYTNRGENYKSFVSLGASCPLKNTKDIDNSINLFYKKRALTLISVKETEKPVDWLLSKDKNNKLERFLKKSKFVNRQNYRNYYIPNGSIYVFNTKKLIDNINKNQDYFNKRTYCYVMPKERSVDIDDLTDLKLAKFYYKK